MNGNQMARVKSITDEVYKLVIPGMLFVIIGQLTDIQKDRAVDKAVTAGHTVSIQSLTGRMDRHESMFTLHYPNPAPSDLRPTHMLNNKTERRKKPRE